MSSARVAYELRCTKPITTPPNEH